MCTFLVVNISSLQLIPINMIAYRSQYGSAHPLAVAGPAFLATLYQHSGRSGGVPRDVQEKAI